MRCSLRKATRLQRDILNAAVSDDTLQLEV